MAVILNSKFVNWQGTCSPTSSAEPVHGTADAGLLWQQGSAPGPMSSLWPSLHFGCGAKSSSEAKHSSWVSTCSSSKAPCSTRPTSGGAGSPSLTLWGLLRCPYAGSTKARFDLQKCTLIHRLDTGWPWVITNFYSGWGWVWVSIRVWRGLPFWSWDL